MANVRDFIPNATAFMTLPIEERAQVLLRYIAAVLAHGRAHRGNLTMRDNLAPVAEGVDVRDLQIAVMEAWVWLEREILILPTPDTHGDGWVIMTKRGRDLLESASPVEWRASEVFRERSADLDPELVAETGAAFRRADFTRAVGNAFLTVELRIRRLARVTDERVNPGDLMAREFNDGGSLRIPGQPDSQAKAVRMLFQGAMLRFRNPHLHGSEPVSTAAEAVRLIQFADLLLAIAAEHAAGANPTV